MSLYSRLHITAAELQSGRVRAIVALKRALGNARAASHRPCGCGEDTTAIVRHSLNQVPQRPICGDTRCSAPRVLCRKHVQSYLDPFVFRFNRRRTRYAAFRSLLGLAATHRPHPYKILISPEAKA